MDTLSSVTHIVCEVLQISDRAAGMDSSTPLLGSIPEFDSMAVVSVITALEEAYGIFVEDDEIDAETFETVGSLTHFIEAKLAQ